MIRPQPLPISALRALLVGACSLAFCAGGQALERGRGQGGFNARGSLFTDKVRPGQVESPEISSTGVVRGYNGMAIDRGPGPFEPRRQILRVPGPRQF